MPQSLRCILEPAKPAGGAAPAAPAAGAPAAAKKPTTVTLIDFARANNIGENPVIFFFLCSVLDHCSPGVPLRAAIMLARFKISYQDIKKAVLEMNEASLTIDNLRSLKQFTPTDEEVCLSPFGVHSPNCHLPFPFCSWNQFASMMAMPTTWAMRRSFSSKFPPFLTWLNALTA